MKYIEDMAGTFKQQNIEENIPEKVTVKELRKALEEYARADREWKEIVMLKALVKKETAGDNIYRLAKALLKNRGFYTYRDAVVDSMDNKNIPSPNPEDFE